jgi:hypothetical protein
MFEDKKIIEIVSVQDILKIFWHIHEFKIQTEEDGRVHVDKRGHGENSGRQGGVKDLADGVVQHVGRVESRVRSLDLG